MDISKYIASGILEEFALGLLGDQEANEVYSLAEQYPEIMAEINAIEESMGQFALSQAITPPPDLLHKVMDRINEVPMESVSTASGQATSSWSRWLVASMVIGLIASLCLNIYFAYWVEAAQENTKTALSENDKCMEEYEALNGLYQEKLRLIEIADDPNFKRIMIAQTDTSLTLFGDGHDAIVYWNPENFEVQVMSRLLPPLETGQQYKLWAIVEGAAIPIDKGIIEHSPTHLQAGDPVPKANAFAVSIEREGIECEGPCGAVILVGAV